MWPWLFVLILCIICVFYSAIQAVTQKFSIFKEKTVRVIVALYSLHAKILQLGRNWRKWTLFSSLTCETRKSTLEANSWLQWLSKHICFVQKCRVRFLLCIGRFCYLLQGFLTDVFQQRPFLSIWAKQIGFEYVYCTFFCSMFLTFSGNLDVVADTIIDLMRRIQKECHVFVEHQTVENTWIKRTWDSPHCISIYKSGFPVFFCD